MFKFIKAITKALSDLSAATAALKAAVEANTSATAGLLITAEETLEAAKATQKSTAYLEQAERHTRRASGHEVPNAG